MKDKKRNSDDETMQPVELATGVLEYQSPVTATHSRKEMGPIEQRIQIGIAIVVLIALLLFVLMIFALLKSGPWWRGMC